MNRGTHPGAAGRRPRDRRRGRLSLLRQHQAEHMAREAQASARSAGRRRPPPAALLLGGGAIVGLVSSGIVVLMLTPDTTRDRLALLFATGLAVWGLVGLAVLVTRRGMPARQSGLVGYDAIRQGLLVAGCLELNLATRMLDLWTPVVCGLLVGVFAVFEVVTLGRRPA